jgi:tyrosine-protein phosphatase 2/3
MLATSTKSACQSPISPTTSHHRSSHPRPATTPHALSPRIPITPQAGPRSPRNKNTPSPSYFGFAVSEDSNPPDSNPGTHARHNWDYPCSNGRGRQSAGLVDTSHSSSLGRTESTHRPSTKDPTNRDQRESKISPGSIVSPPQPLQPKSPSGIGSPQARSGAVSSFGVIQRESLSSPSGRQAAQDKTVPAFLFNVPRQESPAGLSPNGAANESASASRLSLPESGLCAPLQEHAQTQAQRAETLPQSLSKGGPTILPAREFIALLKKSSSTLLLDLRVAPQYSVSRIQGALNLCIPTTLMKRPSFDTQKLQGTFTSEPDRQTFSTWRDCGLIAVYDSNSSNLKEAQNPNNILKKFAVEGWKGQSIILKGGFAAVSQTNPSMIEHGPAAITGDLLKSPLSIIPPAQTVAPVAGGCPLPASKGAVMPFFNNIRQNMDLLDGVGQLSVNHPAEMSERSKEALPEWLQKAVAKADGGKRVSNEFLTIEQTEQKRMQDALDCTVAYGSPLAEQNSKVQIAGVEKGTKNRYNNIFPYDHSRVQLQRKSSAGPCDYINASHVKAAYSNKRYIATQAPVPTTFNDFWHLVWEQDCRVIVMLTAESEGGQVKSHCYWKAGEYGPLKLKLFSERTVPLAQNGASEAKARCRRLNLGPRRSTAPLTEAELLSAYESQQCPDDAPSFIVRHFSLWHSNLPFEPMREVMQLQYTQWPDFGAPASPKHLLALIEQANAFANLSASPHHQVVGELEPAIQTDRPMLVHCSAGCGRTGTFCTVDSVIDMLKRQRKHNKPDRMEIDESDDEAHASEWVNRRDVDLIAKTVQDFRGQRLSMVQSLRQFVLCYESVMEWLVEKNVLVEGFSGKDVDRRGSYHA